MAEISFLDNWYPCSVRFDGMAFPSAENAFQATRFLDRDMRARFACMPASEAAYRGPLFRTTVPGWQGMRYGILYGILQLKFSNPELKKQLMATGDAPIRITNLRHETDLGVCLCSRCRGKGSNATGLLLEKLRKELRYEDERNAAAGWYSAAAS